VCKRYLVLISQRRTIWFMLLPFVSKTAVRFDFIIQCKVMLAVSVQMENYS
jgi:hypothetical protein